LRRNIGRVATECLAVKVRDWFRARGIGTGLRVWRRLELRWAQCIFDRSHVLDDLRILRAPLADRPLERGRLGHARRAASVVVVVPIPVGIAVVAASVAPNEAQNSCG
jgi:hypothetical protein